MESGEVLPLLGETELCHGLSEDERRTIASLGSVGVAAEGTELIREGEPGDTMLLLIEGEVRVEKRDADGGSRELARLGPGAVIGEVTLLCYMPRTATVRAATEVRYFQVERERFDAELKASSPAATRLAIAVGRVLAQRQRALNDKLVELATRLGEQGQSSRAVDDFLAGIVIELED